MLLLPLPFPLLLALAMPAPKAPCSTEIDVFDANPAYTTGVALPAAAASASALEPLTTAAFDGAARRASRAAADGVTLLLVRAAFDDAPGSTAAFRVGAADDSASPGALFRVDDARVNDASALGGAIDTPGVIGPRAVVVPVVAIGGRSFAFALYRAPRDFDGSPETAALASRKVTLTASSGGCVEKTTLTVVRPLLVFIHGTAADNDAWLPFPLWKQSGNELNGFGHGTLPF